MEERRGKKKPPNERINIFVITEEDKQIIVAAKVIVYEEDNDDLYYTTFITPEAYYALKDYIEFRKSHREEVTGESWLICDTWETSDAMNNGCGGYSGLATNPKPLEKLALRRSSIRLCGCKVYVKHYQKEKSAMNVKHLMDFESISKLTRQKQVCNGNISSF